MEERKGETVETKTMFEAMAEGDKSRSAFDDRMGARTNKEMRDDFDAQLKVRTTKEIVKNVLHVVPRYRVLKREEKDIVSKATANMIDEFFKNTL